MNYADIQRYYGSPEWAAKRRACWEAWDYRCSVCDHDWRGVCPLQCHHLPGAYEKLGREDIWTDLRPLCKRHHGKGRITLDGIRLARRAYQWNKRIRWITRLLWRGVVWLVKLPFRKRPTAA